MAESTGTLTEIYIYPIKSCAGVRLSSVTMTEFGLANDRRWVIVDQDGCFQTQRQIPHLVWIEPSITQARMTLRAPSLPELTIPLAGSDATVRPATVWRDTVDAFDMGDDAARWLDAFLEVPGKHFRLLQFDPRHPRTCDPLWTGTGQRQSLHPFTDGFSLNVLSQASLDELNARLSQAGLDEVSALHFRPNLVIDHVPAHEEDYMARLQFASPAGLIEIELVKPCTRCVIPEIDPYTAIREPLVTAIMAKYRRNPSMNQAICFGVNGVLRQGQSLTLEPGTFHYSLKF